jgi:biopolymer transport protein ExbD
LAIDSQGALYLNNGPITESELEQRLVAAASHKPQPELHLRADKATRYEKLAKIMAAAQNAGIARMGFVTMPENH